MSDAPLVKPDDEPLVRWIAMLLVEGLTESEIRRRLTENRLVDSAMPPDAWSALLSASITEAEGMRSMVMSRAELGSQDWLRLDSYTRRKRNLDRLESLVTRAEAEADSINKMNTVAFMVNGLVKAQESMDKFTGAQEAPPAVQVNISYDPIDQFRGVIQSEVEQAKVIDISPTESDEEE